MRARFPALPFRSAIRRLCWPGLAIALAGCASAPPRSGPALVPEPPAAWMAPAGAGAVESAWWRALGDSNLVAIIEEALAANHDLRAAAARVEAAHAVARRAGADALPQASFSGDAARRQQVFVGLPIPGAGGQPLTTRYNSYAATFTVNWELDVWGRLRAGQRAALADAQASEGDFNAARDSLAAQVARAWTAAVEARRQLELAQATATNFAATARQVRARYERGVRSPLDVRLAVANEAAARAGVAARQSQLAAATRQLEILLGRYPAGAVTNLSELPAPAAPVPAGLPGELLERRPDLVAAERRLAASSARAAEARAALLPRLALTGTAGRTSAELEDLLDNSFSLWSIAANLAQSLYQGGRLRANVRLAEARAREATEQYLATVLRAFGEVEAALHDEQHLARREAELAEAVAQSRAAQRLAEDRYASGLEPFLTLLEAQRRAWEAESQWLAVRRARLDNRIQLHLALGGGFGAAEGVAPADHSSPNISSR